MENNNIFKGARYGDRFVTRGGKKGCGEAIYHYYNSSEDRHYLICKEYLGYLSYMSDGTCSLDNKGSFYFDIIKRNEPLINEDELDEMAKEEGDGYGLLFADVSHHCQMNRREGFIDGFKAGARVLICG